MVLLKNLVEWHVIAFQAFVWKSALIRNAGFPINNNFIE